MWTACLTVVALLVALYLNKRAGDRAWARLETHMRRVAEQSGEWADYPPCETEEGQQARGEG